MCVCREGGGGLEGTGVVPFLAYSYALLPLLQPTPTRYCHCCSLPLPPPRHICHACTTSLLLVCHESLGGQEGSCLQGQAEQVRYSVCGHHGLRSELGKLR